MTLTPPGFFDEHPAATEDILFGAACALAVEGAFAAFLLDRWRNGTNTLQAPESAGAKP